MKETTFHISNKKRFNQSRHELMPGCSLECFMVYVTKDLVTPAKHKFMVKGKKHTQIWNCLVSNGCWLYAIFGWFQLNLLFNYIKTGRHTALPVNGYTCLLTCRSDQILVWNKLLFGWLESFWVFPFTIALNSGC